MKRIITILIGFVGLLGIAQEKQTEHNPKKEQDTIKTEIVDVISTYAPKVSDANKINRKPIIELSKNVSKQKLTYSINSIPVASTFVPTTGALKTIDIGKKERLFDSYIAAGFGNNITPYLDAYIHQTQAFDKEYGIHLKGLHSKDPVKDIPLKSTYYNIGADLFYKQEDRYFDWSANLKVDRDMYNWYGLPNTISYTENVINSIDDAQTYKNYELLSALEFDRSYLVNAKGNIGYFADSFSNNEMFGNFSSLLAFPLFESDLNINITADILKGKFNYGYNEKQEKQHQFLTAGINPFYKFKLGKFRFKVGAKGYYSIDSKRNENNYFIYPDVDISFPIAQKAVNLYLGASGDLHTNSFKKFSTENPYISPTLNILQTNELYNFYGGLKGVITSNLNYNIRGNYKDAKNVPLFILQKTKSDGNSTKDSSNGYSILEYEYGNSFNVIYDDIKTIGGVAELDYELNETINFGIKGYFNTYSLKEEEFAWNLPQLNAEIFGMYNTKKWYAGANFYYVGNKKGIEHSITSDEKTAIDVKGFIDLNLNAGYHINPIWSVFVKANNISNGTYQRFNGYNSQGFQVIGGVIWKFDSFF